jgi:hypothetical protein
MPFSPSLSTPLSSATPGVLPLFPSVFRTPTACSVHEEFGTETVLEAEEEVFLSLSPPPSLSLTLTLSLSLASFSSFSSVS